MIATVHTVKKIILTTPRLELVPVSEKYTENIFKELTPQIVTFMTLETHEDMQSAIEYVAEKKRQLEEGEGLPLVITDKKTKEFLGIGALHHIDTDTPEIGLWLTEKAQGKGYGKEVVQALIDWAERNLEYTYLMYPVDINNVASRKLAESQGGKIAEGAEKTVAIKARTLQLLEYRFYKNSH